MPLLNLEDIEAVVWEFPLGDIYATDKARALPINEIAVALLRHRAGDWGNLDPADRRANDQAVTAERPIASCYDRGGVEDLCVVTEGNRRRTAVFLLNEEVNQRCFSYSHYASRCLARTGRKCDL